MIFIDTLLSVLKVQELINIDLIRLGSENDGGYILVNNFYNNGICYSFGIDHNIDFELDMAKYNYQIFMFNHTIDALPQNNSQHFHFFKEGLSGKEESNLHTLEFYLRKNKHEQEKNMI